MVLTDEQFADLITMGRGDHAGLAYAALRARIAELESALRLHLAVDPKDPLLLTPVEQLNKELGNDEVAIVLDHWPSVASR